MPSKPLAGKTIILTGSHVVQSVHTLIEQNGGDVKAFPLIETVETITADDEAWLKRLADYQWLIFTSQNAAASFIAKCKRFRISGDTLTQKIAVVGDKTAKLLREHGLQVHFMPSIFSADMFVKEFQMAPGESALFLRGSLAKSTIHDGTGADEWTVYETRECLQYIKQLEECIVTSFEPIVVFASPSAVEVYAKEIVPLTNWRYVKVASIGHITTAALANYGVVPYVQPKTYTMQAVIEQLILEETNK